MNYIKDVCTKVLGLDWEDNRSSKFTIYIIGENPIKHCYIDGNGFFNDNIGTLVLSFDSIIRGTVTIKKEPKFVPFYDCPLDCTYYSVGKTITNGLYTVRTTNTGSVFDLMCKKTHNMFATGDLSDEQIESVIESLKGE